MRIASSMVAVKKASTEPAWLLSIITLKMLLAIKGESTHKFMACRISGRDFNGSCEGNKCLRFGKFLAA